jgi:hypothetical protein
VFAELDAFLDAYVEGGAGRSDGGRAEGDADERGGDHVEPSR